MKRFIALSVTFATLFCSCSYLLDYKKDVNIAEDIIDDIVKEETGTELNLGPEHQAQSAASEIKISMDDTPGATGAA